MALATDVVSDLNDGHVCPKPFPVYLGSGVTSSLSLEGLERALDTGSA